MKKKIVLSLMMVASLFTIAMAQPPQGGGGQRGSQMMEMLKQRMKEELKLTDAKADSVVAISREFQPKQREIRMDQNLSDDEKKTKIKELMDARKARWKSAGLTDAEIKSVTDFYENMQQRGGGGGPRPNNKK